MRFARRLDAVPPYLFAELERKIEEKRRAGVEAAGKSHSFTS